MTGTSVVMENNQRYTRCFPFDINYAFYNH